MANSDIFYVTGKKYKIEKVVQFFKQLITNGWR